DVLVDERLAARNGDHRRAALVDRVEAFLDREALIEDRIRIIDLAAARAREIAAEQRLQHQHERIALTTKKLLLHDVGADLDFSQKRYRHPMTFQILYRLTGDFRRFERSRQLARLTVRVAKPSVSSAGRRNSMCSSRPGSVETSTGPRRRSALITSSTSTSGADAPAVRPTTSASFTHSGCSAEPSAIR